MSKPDLFIEFLQDDTAWDMFITGNAGTGKTTSLREKVQHLIDNNIPYIVVAFTHKACGILRSKLPKGAKVQTLHSFLCKRPTINTNAVKLKELKTSLQTNKPNEEPRVILIDEFSGVGEKDLMDIRAAQDPEYDAKPKLKAVWIGDLKQLPPVGDIHTIKPKKPYWINLTKQWRNDNPLQEPLNKLISYIDKTAEPAPLDPVPNYFLRGYDLTKLRINEPDKIYLAYTNRRVEELNRHIQGYINPACDDAVFSPSTQKVYSYKHDLQSCDVEVIDIHYDDPLSLGSKYKTLEGLISSDICKFGVFEDEENKQFTFAYVFGHYQYKIMREDLENKAVKANKEIETEFKGFKAAAWAKVNYTHKLARARAKAWREYLSFNDCVICMDFNHAMTVHKSQGSTFNTVILDTDDIAIAAERNFDLYLTLLYVGISRASHKVITS